MLRGIVVLCVLGILTSGCITGPGDKNGRNWQEPGTATESPTPGQNGGGMAGNVTTKGDVTLSIDRPVYRVGEEVRGEFLFSGTLSVHPYTMISRLENGTWANLGFFTFDGSQVTCCGLIPPCQELRASERSPVPIAWDQKVAAGELPVIPPAKATMRPAGPGVYRIQVLYGDKPVCTGAIETEFTIR
jgi:hypothetical protein